VLKQFIYQLLTFHSLKNDVISFFRKSLCALGLELYGLNMFSVIRPFGQVSL